MKRTVFNIILFLLFIIISACNLNNPFQETTYKPVLVSTSEPTMDLTPEPTSESTSAPTPEPTSEPTSAPTQDPTLEPTAEPTTEPTPTPLFQTGQILRQKWDNLNAETTVLSLTSIADYPDNPTSSGYLNTFEMPIDEGGNFGCRIIGYLHPSISGNYTFWQASDDNSELWLSTDSNESNKQLIASVSIFTNPREWDKYPSQESAAIYLNAGSVYFIEAIMKTASDNSNLAVAWLPPGGSQEVIPGTFLSPYE